MLPSTGTDFLVCEALQLQSAIGAPFKTGVRVSVVSLLEEGNSGAQCDRYSYDDAAEAYSKRKAYDTEICVGRRQDFLRWISVSRHGSTAIRGNSLGCCIDTVAARSPVVPNIAACPGWLDLWQRRLQSPGWRPR